MRECIFRWWRERERSSKLCACARAAAHWEDVSFGDILSHEACGEFRRSAAYDLIGDPPYQVLPYPSNPTLTLNTLLLHVYPTLPPTIPMYHKLKLKFKLMAVFLTLFEVLKPPTSHPPTLAYITEAFRAWKLQCIIHFTWWWVVLYIYSEVQIRSLSVRNRIPVRKQACNLGRCNSYLKSETITDWPTDRDK